MKSHSWLIIVTVAVLAIVSYATAKTGSLAMSDDPLFNKMLGPSTTEDNEINIDHPKSTKKIPMADDPQFNKMLPKEHFAEVEKKPKVKPTPTTVGTSISTNQDYSYYEDDYDGEEDDDDDDDISVTSKTASKVPSTTAAAPKTTYTTKLRTTTMKFIPIKPAEGVQDSTSHEIISDEDSSEEDDEDDDDDDDDDEEIDVASCPRDCLCSRQLNNYLLASCSRLDAGIQKFTLDVTDLEVVNVPQKNPIVLSAAFFKNIGLQNISTIKIVNSFIENVHPRAFEGLNELYSVNLTNSGINVLHPDTFSENKKLRILTLAGNDLRQMQQNATPFMEYMLKAPSVEELDLSGCNLKHILSTAFRKLDNIVFINLANNDLDTLPEKLFEHVETIEELDLSSNKITMLPRHIFNRTSLAILILKYNNFKTNLEFGTPEIQKLDLSFNQIDTIHSEMFQTMPGLMSLILKGNMIKKIYSTAFFNLKDLRQIDLSFNNLEQLSSQVFYRNRDLDVIRLNDNSGLKKLPLDGFECQTGKFNVYLFDISNCDISELGDNTFVTMPRITTLNLAWNNIESLSKEFFRTLTKLVELNLNNNLITEFNDLVFLQNRNLKKLNLAGNPLTKLSPRMFLTLRDLSELDISNCDLVDLWSEPVTSFVYSSMLKNLKLLNMSNNEVRHARHTHYSTMENLEVLDLNNNPLHCDDGFHQLIKWLAARKIKPGSAHVGFNAEMHAADSGVIEIKSFTSWTHFENYTCSLAHANHAEVLPSKDDEIDDDIINDPIDSSSVENDSSSESDEETNEIKENPKIEIEKKKPTIASVVKDNKIVVTDNADDDDEDDDEDDDDYDEDESGDEIEIDDRTTDPLKTAVEIEEEIAAISDRLDERYRYFIPMMIIIFGVLAILLLVAKFVSILMHRRGERYRQALLASKNSIIYQKLSEEINTPQTPKVHRYSPISQV